jgi:hypothetical protein
MYSTNFWYNTPGTRFTNNGFNSFFSLNANVITDTGLNSQPFIRVYNRMFKNGANSAIDLKTFGNSNSNVNSDVLIRLDSGGDPTPGANAGTITYNINGSDKHIMTGSSFGIKIMEMYAIINNGLLTINAADWSNSGTKGIIFRNGYDTPNNNNHNCSILTYDHDNQGFSDGLSINAFDGISFCTGSNTRLERMRITSAGNVACAGSISCVGVSASGGMRIGANLGIQNTIHYLCYILEIVQFNSAPGYCIW